jgi:hypothetical protein
MLATDNETKYFHPSGYPAIMLYPEDLAFGDKPSYCMGRDYEAIKKYVEENSKAYKRATGAIA